jgi:hypothetical protein
VIHAKLSQTIEATLDGRNALVSGGLRDSCYNLALQRDQVVQLVDVRLGHNSHGLRLGLTIRRLNRTTHPSYVECHVRAGLQWLLPREEELVFNAARDLRTPEIDVENMVTVFWRCIQDRVLPILDSTRTLEGIRVLLESDFGRRFQVERVVTESGILRGDALNRRDRPEPD